MVEPGRWDYPIYTQLPEGLIEIRTAAQKYGRTAHTLRDWVERGLIQSRGRLRGRAPGGGFILISEQELIAFLENPPQRGRPRKYP